MSVEAMYQEIILEHYREKHHNGLREPFHAEVHHVNPTCGDEVTLRVALDGERVADVSYDGVGCSRLRGSGSSGRRRRSTAAALWPSPWPPGTGSTSTRTT